MVKNNYQKYFEEYKSIFEPLFKAAFDKSQFNVVMSILAFRGMSDAGWDPFENTEDVFHEMGRQQRKFRHGLLTNMNLWLYVHIVECSENYELIANLINTVEGKDYIIANNKNKNYVNLSVLEKIARLKSKARLTDFSEVYKPFQDTFDSRFRNAIGHADYAVKSGSRSGITIMDDAGFPKLYNDQETLDLLNRSLALQGVIIALRNAYTNFYKKSVVIESSPSFGHGTPIDVTLIVRKNHGVIGFRCIGGYDLGKPFETLIIRAFGYEKLMIENGINNLPASRFKIVNKLLDLLPRRLAERLVPKLEKYYINKH